MKVWSTTISVAYHDICDGTSNRKSNLKQKNAGIRNLNHAYGSKVANGGDNEV